MVARTSPVTMTLEEWGAMDEDEPGELVDGLLVEEEVPSYVHELVVAFLVEALRIWARGNGALVAASGAKFAVTTDRGRMPDVSVYLAGGARPPGYGVIGVPPSIAVEVISPTPRDARRDRIDKLAEYAAFGVRWYWLVDPKARTFEILELGAAGKYVHVVGSGDAPIEDVPGCAGLRIDVPAMWSEIEPFGDEA